MEGCQRETLLRRISQSYEGNDYKIQSLNMKGKMNEYEKTIES